MKGRCTLTRRACATSLLRWQVKVRPRCSKPAPFWFGSRRRPTTTAPATAKWGALGSYAGVVPDHRWLLLVRQPGSEREGHAALLRPCQGAALARATSASSNGCSCIADGRSSATTVQGTTGNNLGGTGCSDLNGYLDKDVLLPVVATPRSANGSHGQYHVVAFALFHLTGWSTNGNNAGGTLDKQCDASADGGVNENVNKPCIRGCSRASPPRVRSSFLAVTCGPASSNPLDLPRPPHRLTPTANRPERTPHIMNRRRVTGAIVAMALAGVGAVGLVSWANSTKADAEASEAQTAVVIVDKQVPKGADAATIKAATHVGTVQRKALQPGALTSEEQIGNQVAVSDLQPGDQLVKARLAAAVQSDHADKVTISATFSAERAVGGTHQGRGHRGRVPQLRAVRHEQARVGHHHTGQDPQHHAPGVPPGAGHQRPDHWRSGLEPEGRPVAGVVVATTSSRWPSPRRSPSASCSPRSSGTCGSRTNRPRSRTMAPASSRWATSTRWRSDGRHHHLRPRRPPEGCG